MKEYKTFGYYLLELIKIFCFGAVLAWLASCSNRKQKVIDAIHACEDSIARNEFMIRSFIASNDSAIAAYHATCPPMLFYYNKYSNIQRIRYKTIENIAYKQYVSYRSNIYARQLLGRARIKQFQKRIDSLKLELYK